MKLLILDLYRLSYRLTGKNTPAIAITLIYITFLNLIITYALGILLEGLYHITSIVHNLYAFPYIIGTSVLMFLISVSIMSPFKNIKKELKKKPGYWGITMYTGVALVVFLYTRYGNSLF